MPIRLGLGITLDRSQSLYGTGTAAGRLLGSEPVGFAIDFANDSALIRWPSSPAGQYSGNIAGLISASVLSFSRASTATYFDANGVMQTASNDVLRRTYDPSTLTALGYLPEPQRTNLQTQSGAFDNATWNKTRSSVSAAAATGPDGTLSAYKLIEDTSTTNSHQLWAGQTVAAAAHVQGYFLKAGERTRVELIAFAFGNTARGFDLSNGTTFPNTVGLSEPTAYGMIPWGGGWYYCWIAGTGTAVSSSVRIYLNNGTTATYTGNGLSGVYVWGAQLEAGSYPTSYIPTTSATVTRAADVMSAALSKLPFSSSVGSLIAIAQPSPDTASNGFGLAQLDDGSDSNRIGLTNGIAGSKIARATVVNSGSADADISSASNAAASRFKQALAWAANDIEMVVGGVASTKDTSCAVPSGLTTLRIGSKVAASTQWSAPAESLVYIPRRLGQGELIGRTS